MRPVMWMVAGAVVSWLVSLAVVDRRTAVEVLLGMAAPLAVASGTWVMTEQVYRRRPERLTGLMIAAFAAKLVFFGAYVAVMLAVLGLRPAPFMISFTGYFVALHAAEAFLLQRLFAGGTRESR